jgi:hypothetical protein
VGGVDDRVEQDQVVSSYLDNQLERLAVIKIIRKNMM